MAQTGRTFFLVHDQARAGVKRAIDDPAYVGWKVRITPPSKSRDQEEKYHAMVRDIKKSGLFCFLGRSDWSEEDVKRLLVDAFAAEMAAHGTPLSQSGHVVPSLDMQRTVQLGIQTRKFLKAEASNFVEYLYAYGASLGVEWSDRPTSEAA